MHWILFVISVSVTGDNLQRLGTFDTMSECFGAWEEVHGIMTDYGDHPEKKIGKQIVCVQVNKKDQMGD